MIIGPASGFTPRIYQEHAINGGDPHKGPGIMPCFSRYKRVLAVLFTGGGKTEIFLSLVRRYLESPKTPPGKRALILAHRDELVSQPISRASRFGLQLAREQGDQTAVGSPERAIASTIQTMRLRKERYARDEIGLIICDEGHHSVADDFREVLSYFSDAYILGVTATPQRLDGIALGELYEAVAFKYGIEQGVADGWLVPIKPWREIIDGLDLSQLRTRAGDLEPGALGELMAEYAHPVAKLLVERAGDRPTIAFCATLPHAYAQAEALKRYTNARVEVIDGNTKKRGKRKQTSLLGPPVREDIVEDFRAGRIQFLVNVGVAIEGFDAPNCRCVALIRPTKSPALVVQAVGRGTRPLPGIVDQPDLRDDADGRIAAIAASAKPDLLVLDFSGASEKHTLAGVVDALSGNLTPEERLALTKIPVVGDLSIDQVLAQARIAAAEAAARQAELARELLTHSYEVDPFHPVVVFGIKDLRDDPAEKRASEKMAAYLARNGVANAAALSASTAKKLQGTIIVRGRLGLSSFSQSIALQRAGVPPVRTIKMSFDVASQLMAELHQNRGARPRRWDSDPMLGGQAK
jgi:superfamily II DNA or RNA helicase